MAKQLSTYLLLWDDVSNGMFDPQCMGTYVLLIAVGVKKEAHQWLEIGIRTY